MKEIKMKVLINFTKITATAFAPLNSGISFVPAVAINIAITRSAEPRLLKRL
jgi:hypothetical protein